MELNFSCPVRLSQSRRGERENEIRLFLLLVKIVVLPFSEALSRYSYFHEILVQINPKRTSTFNTSENVPDSYHSRSS